MALQLACPRGTYGRVAPRSGLAVHYGIAVGAGVVDRDYRGNIAVLLFNLSDAPFKVGLLERLRARKCIRR